MNNTTHLTPTDAHSWVALAVLPSFHKPPGFELRALPLVVEYHRSSVGPSAASSAGPQAASSVGQQAASSAVPSAGPQPVTQAGPQVGPQAGPQVVPQAGHQE